MSTDIRSFTTDDIDFALAQTARECWDNTAHTFRICLAHDPDGCFIAEVNGRRAGMITTMRYARSAWLGNLIVHPDYRRRGLGERLMVHAMTLLDGHGVRTLRLEADPMGVEVYRRLGFVDQFDSPRYRREPSHAAQRNGVAPLDETHLEAVTAFDREALDTIISFDRVCFGDDRGRLFRMLRENARGAYCVRENTRVLGFAIALPSLGGVRLGPWCAETPAVAKELLNAFLADFTNSTVVVGVPGVNPSSVSLLESHGFSRAPSSLRMIRGDNEGAGDPDRLFAIANGAMG